jgi:putative membrane protein
MLPPMKLLLKWLLSAAALMFVAYLYPGCRSAAWAQPGGGPGHRPVQRRAARPILVVLTLPVTVVTLGLFLFVINASCSGPPPSCSRLPGHGFGAALLGSLIYSALGMVIDSALRSLFPQQ